MSTSGRDEEVRKLFANGEGSSEEQIVVEKRIRIIFEETKGVLKPTKEGGALLRLIRKGEHYFARAHVKGPFWAKPGCRREKYFWNSAWEEKEWDETSSSFTYEDIQEAVRLQKIKDLQIDDFPEKAKKNEGYAFRLIGTLCVLAQFHLRNSDVMRWERLHSYDPTLEEDVHERPLLFFEIDTNSEYTLGGLFFNKYHRKKIEKHEESTHAIYTHHERRG